MGDVKAFVTKWCAGHDSGTLGPKIRADLESLLAAERAAARVEALSLAGTIAALALPEAQCHSRCYVLGATLCYRCQCVEAIHRALAARAEEEDRG